MFFGDEKEGQSITEKDGNECIKKLQLNLFLGQAMITMIQKRKMFLGILLMLFLVMTK